MQLGARLLAKGLTLEKATQCFTNASYYPEDPEAGAGVSLLEHAYVSAKWNCSMQGEKPHFRINKCYYNRPFNGNSDFEKLLDWQVRHLWQSLTITSAGLHVPGSPDARSFRQQSWRPMLRKA